MLGGGIAGQCWHCGRILMLRCSSCLRSGGFVVCACLCALCLGRHSGEGPDKARTSCTGSVAIAIEIKVGGGAGQLEVRSAVCSGCVPDHQSQLLPVWVWVVQGILVGRLRIDLGMGRIPTSVMWSPQSTEPLRICCVNDRRLVEFAPPVALSEVLRPNIVGRMAHCSGW